MTPYIWTQFENGDPTGLSVVVLARNKRQEAGMVQEQLLGRGISLTIKALEISEILDTKIIDFRPRKEGPGFLA